MTPDRELAALLFELRRSTSPVDRARALARAWRTVRKLSPTERRFLAREIGFDGAEELVEGVAGKDGGVAPAAILEALGAMRRDEGFSIRGVLGALKDPSRRDDLLVRGVDLVADAVEDEPEPPPKPRPPLPTDEIDQVELRDTSVGSAVGVVERVEDDPDEPFEEPADDPMMSAHAEPVSDGRPPSIEAGETPPAIAPEDQEQEPPPAAESGSAAVPAPRPDPEPEVPSPWDEGWERPTEPVERLPVPPTPADLPSAESVSGAADQSVLERLRAFRDELEAMRAASTAAIVTALDRFPEPWARRRALVALIEAGACTDSGRVLDLIEGLDRPMDRRWCLAALAYRGGLAGSHLERAMGMLDSPAARRRVESLARG